MAQPLITTVNHNKANYKYIMKYTAYENVYRLMEHLIQ